MSDRDKDVEILALRHQITVLERQLSGTRVRFTAPDRAFRAALLHRLAPEALRRMRLLVRPETVLRWHRDLIADRHAARSKPKRPGRPPTVRSIRVLVLRPVWENPSWGYGERHSQARDGVLRPGERAPKVIYSLVRELAVDGIPVAVACRVLKVSKSGYYDWLGRPELPRDLTTRSSPK
jgi:hypothetical protein